MNNRASLIGTCLLTVALASLAEPAAARLEASSRLLLSYFEVDLENAETTTLFAVTNVADRAVSVRASIYSNWGVPVLDTTFELAARQVLSGDLERWLAQGRLPDRRLGAPEIEHVQAALSGQRSPASDMFYSKETGFRRAVGYVLFETAGEPAGPRVLIGDAFQISPAPGPGEARGEALLDVGRADGAAATCTRHGLRFLAGAFDADTEVFVWTRRHGQPSADGYLLESDKVRAEMRVFAESGKAVETQTLELLPVDLLRVSELGLPESHGWLDLVTEVPSHVAVRHSARGRYSVGLETFCLPEPAAADPQIRLEASVRGEGSAYGGSIPAGAPVLWEYRITNTGDVPLAGVTVQDTHGADPSCPQGTLEPSGSMVCSAAGVAEACRQVHAAVARATAPDGRAVEDRDPSSYFGTVDAAVEIETETRGPDGEWLDADDPSGPLPGFTVGGEALQRAEWRYRVTNTGEVALDPVRVRNDQGWPVDCPSRRLAPGESMTCTATGAPGLGLVRHLGEVTASAESACAVEVLDADPSYHRGQAGFVCGTHFETFTNGRDADSPPGPAIPAGQEVTWTFEIANTLFPARAIDHVAVNRRQVLPGPGEDVSVDCPRRRLEPGEAMTCTATGVAVAGLFSIEGRVTYDVGGVATPGPHCASFDVSHYSGG